MNLYVYSQPNGALSTRGRAEGLDGIIDETHPRFIEYCNSGREGLYILIGNVPNSTLPIDVFQTRAYSTNFKPQAQILKRLLLIRSTWSKK